MTCRPILTVVLCAIVVTATAQAEKDGNAPRRMLDVTISGCGKDTLYLANYYGNKLYYADTAVADAKGRAVFNAARGYKAGVYAVVTPGPKLFEVILNEPKVVLTTRKEDLLGGLVVKESRENEVFLNYIRFLNERKADGDRLRAQQETNSDPLAKAGIRRQLEELDTRVKTYQRELIQGNTGLLAADLVHMSMAVELPEPRKPDGSLDSAAAYYQYRAHFWDHFDLADDRLVRVPVFGNKFEEWISRVVPQVPDTITRLVDELVARTGGSKEVFRYVVHGVTHKYETSEIMGMDAVFVHMALTYYCPRNGQPNRADWMEQEKLDKLCERARKMSPLVLGRKAPYLCLTDTTEQKWINFHDLPQDYVVIVFWDPHCGHCKEELPAMHKVYTETLKPMGIEVFAVAKAVDETLMRDWKKFIREKNLDWVNVGLTKTVFENAKKDPRQYIPRYTTLESLNYSDTYDVYSTPKVFLVDKERRFAGKQLSADQIADLVGKLRERKANN
jgi:thiol-disulfide isomerase/thioredoxin